jgi:predicted TIM-barrel fold metal-dependent hydrolase
MNEFPRIISVDDHVLEPPHVWETWLAEKYKDRAPRLVRQKGVIRQGRRRAFFKETDEGDWADVWVFDDKAMPLQGGLASAGSDRETVSNAPITYDSIRPGAYQRDARLADMDTNQTEATLCFPTFPRFCGQTFLECEDRDLALACVRAYNDWMLQEWCADEGRGRLLPMTLIPLWDANDAAEEVRRNAEIGNTSIAFSESPPALDLPSIHSGYWDPLWQACVDTETVVNCHIGSSSTFPTTGPDSPMLTTLSLVHEGSQRCLVDWLCSGIFERFDTLRVALSEGGIGWIPFLLERIDYTFKSHEAYAGVDYLTKRPSEYMEGHVYGCLVDDLIGLQNRDRLPVHQLMFEVDFPHGDSNWPHSMATFTRLAAEAQLTDEEALGIVRNNAIDCYRLERFGLEKAVPAAATASV